MAAPGEVRESPWSAEGDAAFRVTAWLEAGRPARLRVVTQLGKYGSEESIFEFANGELRSGRVFAECLESICEPGLSQQRLRFSRGRIVAVETRRAASLTLLLQKPYRATPVSMALATIEAVELYLRSPGIQSRTLRVNADGLGFEHGELLRLAPRVREEIQRWAGQTVEFRHTSHYRFDEGIVDEVTWIGPAIR